MESRLALAATFSLLHGWGGPFPQNEIIYSSQVIAWQSLKQGVLLIVLSACAPSHHIAYDVILPVRTTSQPWTKLLQVIVR